VLRAVLGGDIARHVFPRAGGALPRAQVRRSVAIVGRCHCGERTASLAATFLPTERPGPPMNNDPSPAASMLFARYLAQRERGEAVDLEDLIAARPELEGELRAIESDERHVGDVARDGGLGGGTDAVDLARLAPLDPDEPWTSGRTRALLSAMRGRAPSSRRFDLRGVLGKGGMGEVVRAFDGDLRRELAVKRIRPDRRARRDADEREDYEALLLRFVAEAQVCAQLNHPGIIPVYEMGLDELGHPYFSMPEVQGITLEDVFARYREGATEWSLPRVVEVLLRIADTMAYAHSRHVVHRDLKPQNVMVGEFGVVYVMDWGLARAEDQGPDTMRGGLSDESPDTPFATTGAQPGTPLYMASEQARGEATSPASDVYALGVMLDELLSGHAAYFVVGGDNRPQTVRDRVIAGPPPTLAVRAPDAPAELVAIAEKAMARSVAERYASMGDLAADIRAFLEQRVVGAYRTGAWAELRKWVARNRGTARAIGATVLAILAGVTAVAVLLSLRRDDAVRALEKERRLTALANAEAANARSAELETRSALASLSLRAARLAAQRGRWTESLQQLDEAARLGYAPITEVEVARVDALRALGRVDDAHQLLVRLRERTDLGDQRAKVLLRLGCGAFSHLAGGEDRLLLVQEARELGLDGADAHVAAGLLAPTSAAALESFRRALQENPTDHEAATQLIALHLLLGEHDRARLECGTFERFFPWDPLPASIRTLAAALEGNQAEVDAAREAIGGNLDRGALDLLDEILGVLGAARATLSPAFYRGTADAQTVRDQPLLIVRIGALMTRIQSEDVDPAVGAFLPNHAFLRSFGGHLMRAQSASTKGRSRAACAAAEQALQFHDDGYAWYLWGSNWLSLEETETGGRIGKLQRAVELFERAASRPTYVPGIARAARRWSLLCLHELITSHDCANLRRGFYAIATKFLEAAPADADELQEVGLLTLLVSQERDREGLLLGLALLDRLETLGPPNVDALRYRAKAEAWLGNAEASDAAIERMVAVDSNQAQHLRDTVVAPLVARIAKLAPPNLLAPAEAVPVPSGR